MANYTNAQLVMMIYASTSFLVLPGLIGWYFEGKREAREGYGEITEDITPPPFRREDHPEISRAA